MSKIILTVVTSQGKDAVITDVPPAAIEVLRLTCPGLLMLPSTSLGAGPTDSNASGA